jgi:hypothetical protein
MAVKEKQFQTLLGPGQVQEFKAKIASYKRFLETHKQSPFKRVRESDETFARQEIKRYEKLLADRTAPSMDATQKNTMLRRVKYLEAKIKEGMPSKDEMMGKRHSDPDNINRKYQEAIPKVVDQHIAWERTNGARIREWKYLKRVLEPENPHATNVESLRQIH